MLGEDKRDLWDAMVSCVSGRDGRFMVHEHPVGTSPMFAELRQRRADPAVVWHEYKADENCDIEDRDTVGKGTPPGRVGPREKPTRYLESRSSRGCGSGWQ